MVRAKSIDTSVPSVIQNLESDVGFSNLNFIKVLQLPRLADAATINLLDCPHINPGPIAALVPWPRAIQYHPFPFLASQGAVFAAHLGMSYDDVVAQMSADCYG